MAFTMVKVRYTLITLHALMTLAYFILSFLHDTFLWLISVISFFPMIVYLPLALWYGRRASTRVFDRAGAEVGYLVLQTAWWLTLATLGLYYAGPNECARWSYELGRAQAHNPELSDGPGLSEAVIDSCDLDTALNVFACLHVVFLLAWMGYIIYRVRQLPFTKGRFKCGVSRLLRGEYEPVGHGKDVELGSVRNHGGPEGSGSNMGSTIASPVSNDPQRGNQNTNQDTPPPHRPSLIPPPEIEAPPAYEPQPISPVDHQRQPVSPIQDGTAHAPGESRTMDFDTYMRIQQLRMEEKLSLQRRDAQTPESRVDSSHEPLGGGNENGTNKSWNIGPGASSRIGGEWGAGPSTARRRRSA